MCIRDSLGLAYPIFASFVAMETKDKDDDRLWLTYWVVFGVVRQAETYFSWLYTFIPFYIFFRLGFYITRTRRCLFAIDRQ